MTFAIWTLGCKLNQSESEAIANSFVHNGFILVELDKNPNIIIINSCTVTSKAEQKARRVLRKLILENPNSAVIITGCYAEVDGDNLKKELPSLFVFSIDKKASLLELPDFYRKNVEVYETPKKVVEFFLKQPNLNSDPFAFQIDTQVYKIRAFLKIEDGCNNSCTYCRVTIARGDAKSLHYDEVVSRVVRLEKLGFQEVVLTGVNISMYDFDGIKLPSLIKKILDATSTIRIRLSSIEPDFIDDEFIEVIKDERVCNHFHLPIQSGSNNILKLMDRHYKAEDVIVSVNKLKDAKKNPYLSCDIIVGFNEESDKDFLETYNLIKDNNFSFAHVFPYSKRPQTKAFNFKNPIPERIRDLRAAKLRELSNKLFLNYQNQFENKEVEIIVEDVISINNKLYAVGLTSNYLKAKVEVENNKIIGKKIKTFFKSY